MKYSSAGYFATKGSTRVPGRTLVSNFAIVHRRPNLVVEQAWCGKERTAARWSKRVKPRKREVLQSTVYAESMGMW